jgi:hypothetical protein
LREVRPHLLHVDVFDDVAPYLRDLVHSRLLLYEYEFVALDALGFVYIGVEEVDYLFDEKYAVWNVVAFVVYFEEDRRNRQIKLLYEVVLVEIGRAHV